MLPAMAIKFLITFLILGGIYTCVQDHFEEKFEKKNKAKVIKRDSKRNSKADDFREGVGKRNKRMDGATSHEEKVKIYMDSKK